jgi:molybdopterin-synthase adenylyltransferase
MLKARCIDLPNQTRTEIRVPYREGLEIKETLLDHEEEKVAIATIRIAKTSSNTILLVRSIIPVATNWKRSFHGATWPATTSVEMIDRAEKLQTGLLILHSHGNVASPGLSSTDARSADELCLAFRTAIPDQAHGSIVFGRGGSVGGKVWLPHEELPYMVSRIRWVSDPVRLLPREYPSAAEQEMYSRQKLLIGEKGQEILRGSKVGVIGVGGGGSMVVQELALLGVGKIIGVDSDILEETNRHRVVGSTPLDVEQKQRKISIMERMVKSLNPGVDFLGIQERFPSDESVKQLKECDVIVGSVDTLNARQEIQVFAWRYLIPYVDIGLTIQVGNTKVGTRINGQVYDLIPGAACLWCAQFLTTSRLATESGGRGPTYISGSEQRAQVVTFNGVLASAAVTEVLQILTGFASRKRVPNALQFDGALGTLVPVKLERKEECPVCSNELGRGDSIWRSDGPRSAVFPPREPLHAGGDSKVGVHDHESTAR